jgi:hypothetical protein
MTCRLSTLDTGKTTLFNIKNCFILPTQYIYSIHRILKIYKDYFLSLH